MFGEIVEKLLKVQKSIGEFGFKILEITPTNLTGINLLWDSPAFLKDGDGSWKCPPREHGRVIGIRVIKSGKQEESDEMLSWQKLQIQQVLEGLRASKSKVFDMIDKGVPDIGNLMIIRLAVEACVSRLELVMKDEAPVDEVALKRGE